MWGGKIMVLKYKQKYYLKEWSHVDLEYAPTLRLFKMNEKKVGEAYKLIPIFIVNFSHCFFFLMTKNEKMSNCF